MRNIEYLVSIRAPAWGATKAALYHHPHCLVSIRAPAWGATRRAARWGGRNHVSIRAPAWGATHFYPPLIFILGFQFALPHGERRWHARGITVIKLVSIRAPAWGATKHPAWLLLANDVSIRAPAWGATLIRRSAKGAGLFQFALPHGERLEIARRAKRYY